MAPIPNETQSGARRRRDLAKIHIAKKQLGLDDESYREILYQVAGVRTSAMLDEAGRILVIKRFKELGFKPVRSNKNDGYASFHRTAAKSGMHVPATADRSPLLSKIGAILADLSLPWSYADGIAKRMFKVDRVRWLYPVQLHKVVSVLIYSKKRKEKNEKAKGGGSENQEKIMPTMGETFKQETI